MLRALGMKSALLALLLAKSLTTASAQDWISAATNRGLPIRIAVPDFSASTPDPQTASLSTVFNQTLWNDLDNAGIFEVVSKSFYPLQAPGAPDKIKLEAWAHAPVNAASVAFGNLGVSQGKLTVQAWLFNASNAQLRQVLGKQYQEAATPDNARLIAHRFADQIIYEMGAGIPGVAETNIVFISSRSGHKEVWAMDYDGAGQEQLTHLNSIALSPRLSSDHLRVAFSGLVRGSWQILMYSLDLGHLVSSRSFAGDNFSPAWSSDGSTIAFSSSAAGGDPEIFIADTRTAGLKRLTAIKGSDVSPVWNPKTNRQIAWVSDRNGLPQIFIMEADGSHVQQITNEGYAISPTWSPNGRLLAFSWTRHYGPASPGGRDIYVMDLASRQFLQLTHDAGRNDFPSWSPDGRQLVFQSDRTGSEQIWTMLADGTHQQQLTRSGRNLQPNWGTASEAPAAANSKWDNKGEASAQMTLPETATRIAAAPPSAEVETFNLIVPDIYFDYDKAELRPESQRVLDQAAKLIRSHPDWTVTIEGNCDERGSTESSLGLGEERAEAAKEVLVKAGLSPDRLKVVSYGKEKPVCTESNEDCWQKNSHDHFVLQ